MMQHPGLIPTYKTVLGAGAIYKTCDKPINFIDCVSHSFIFLQIQLKVYNHHYQLYR